MTMELVQEEMDFEALASPESEAQVQVLPVQSNPVVQDELIAQCLAAIKDTLDRHGCLLNVTFMPVINVVRREENATS